MAAKTRKISATRSNIQVRVDPTVKALFIAKAQREFGTYSRLINKFIAFYVLDGFVTPDESDAALIHAVRSLYSFTNNLNQITKRLHIEGELDEGFTPEVLTEVRELIDNVIVAFKEVSQFQTERMQTLMSEIDA